MSKQGKEELIENIFSYALYSNLCALLFSFCNCTVYYRLGVFANATTRMFCYILDGFEWSNFLVYP